MSDDIERLRVELRFAAADFPGVVNTIFEAADALAALVKERDEARNKLAIANIDDMNDLVLMGLARDEAYAGLAATRATEPKA